MAYHRGPKATTEANRPCMADETWRGGGKWSWKRSNNMAVIENFKIETKAIQPGVQRPAEFNKDKIVFMWFFFLLSHVSHDNKALYTQSSLVILNNKGKKKKNSYIFFSTSRSKRKLVKFCTSTCIPREK